MYSNEDLVSTVDTQFYAPAVDWLGNGAKKGIEYTHHWHGMAKTEKVEKARFLAIVQVVDKESEEGFLSIKKGNQGEFVVGEWQIMVKLSPDVPAGFQAINEKTSSGFSHNVQDIRIGEKVFRHTIKGSTLIVENDGELREEAVDVLPDAVIFY